MLSSIKKLRLEKNLTQFEMADKLGVKVETYRNYETGYTNMPNDVMVKFLRLRALEDDLKLANILEELCTKKK